MSKQIKQMEMDALKRSFGTVRDLVVLTATGINCQTDNQLRLSLRKKNVRLQVVKNSLMRRVFDELGVKLVADSPMWKGSSLMAWGGSSLADLSRTLDAELKELIKKNAQLKDKVSFKGALAEGQPVTFEQALKMPTRAEACGRVVGLLLSPARRIASQILAPAARVAGQVKMLGERVPEGQAAPAAT